MPWLHVRAQAPGAVAEHVGDRLHDAGAVAVSLLPADPNDLGALEPPPQREPLLWNEVRVEALLPLGADLSTLPLDCDIDFMADEDWSETWRRGFGERRFGRLRIVEASCQAAAAPGQATVRLDPGLAFGTGTHPTTALCLDWLAAQDLAGKRVLDVGAGSGILAIAALRLGAAAATAIDHDPQARRACRENALANGVRLAVVDGLDAVDDLDTVRGKFDIAVANIVADVLSAMAADIGERAERIALSGVLERQTEQMRNAFAAFEFAPPAVREGWVLLSGVRRE